MGETTSAAQLFDRVADNGEALTRGYLELVLDEQHCAGASPSAEDGSRSLTLTLYVLDRAETARDHFVFATRVKKNEATPEVAQRLLMRLMERLTLKHGISTFATPGEITEDQLEGFRSEVEFATTAWVD